MSLKNSNVAGYIMTAKTMTGTDVTINDSDIIIFEGKPLIMFFVVDSNGQHGMFSQHELTDYKEI